MKWHATKLADHIEFNTVKRDHTVNIAKSDKILSKMICYDAGQSTPVHSHATQDEVFYVIKGKGTMILNDKNVLLETMMVIFVPAGTKHGINADKNSQLVITFVKSPGTV